MDESVQKAMARWPDVPFCYGWLRLDTRGRWWVPSGVLPHDRIGAFIGRNYTCDAAGCWYFQNGPQRVYVQLDYTPWILRWFPAEGIWRTHTNLVVTPTEGWMDEDGRLLLLTAQGPGLVDDRDLGALANCLRECAEGIALDLPDNRLLLGSIARADVAERFHYDPQPREPVQ